MEGKLFLQEPAPVGYGSAECGVVSTQSGGGAQVNAVAVCCVTLGVMRTSIAEGETN